MGWNLSAHAEDSVRVNGCPAQNSHSLLLVNLNWFDHLVEVLLSVLWQNAKGENLCGKPLKNSLTDLTSTG